MGVDLARFDLASTFRPDPDQYVINDYYIIVILCIYHVLYIRWPVGVTISKAILRAINKTFI